MLGLRSKSGSERFITAAKQDIRISRKPTLRLRDFVSGIVKISHPFCDFHPVFPTGWHFASFLIMAKVLVVEDDTDTGATIKDLLVLESHIVEVVADGAEAASRLQQYDYDLIVLDWELPDTTGVEVLKEYRQQRGKTPVLMLTGRSDFADKETGWIRGQMII